MKPTWVMTDEEKKEKREKTIKRKQLPPTLPKDKVQVQLKFILHNIFLSLTKPFHFFLYQFDADFIKKLIKNVIDHFFGFISYDFKV